MKCEVLALVDGLLAERHCCGGGLASAQSLRVYRVDSTVATVP